MSKSAQQPVRVYWDACVFVSLIEGTQDRLPNIEAVIDEVDRGRFEIYTSYLSIAEVSFVKSEKDGKLLSSAIERRIDKLWAAGSPFRLVELHRSVADEAKRLLRAAVAKGLPLKPPDAIHLATAKRVGAGDFRRMTNSKVSLRRSRRSPA